METMERRDCPQCLPLVSLQNGLVTKEYKSDSFTALNNVKRCITAGCLSVIPPGGGTKRNKRLREHINVFFL